MPMTCCERGRAKSLEAIGGKAMGFHDDIEEYMAWMIYVRLIFPERHLCRVIVWWLMHFVVESDCMTMCEMPSKAFWCLRTYRTIATSTLRCLMFVDESCSCSI
jgi:hypothetical protein